MSFAHNNQPVAVAVSGGADSLHTLITLQESGLNVIAVHGLFHSESLLAAQREAGFNNPTLEKNVEGLHQACKKLGVPFFLADCRDSFTTLVVKPFVEAYAAGFTPNPCALCNTGIKFGLLLEESLKLGAKSFATGHYARLERTLEGCSENSEDGYPALLQGSDPLKDQSYFLGLVKRDYLKKVFFPLGKAKKIDVLADLARRGITPPQPGESQEICFIPGNSYRTLLPFLAQSFGIALSQSGPMLLLGGEKVGTHKGLWNYTEGQRKGLGVGWKEPLHVIGKEGKKNILRLGNKSEGATVGCCCSHVNFLVSPEYWPDTLYVKTRYRETPCKAEVSVLYDETEERLNAAIESTSILHAPTAETIKTDSATTVDKTLVEKDDGKQDKALFLRIRFLTPQGPIAPGQLAAVYREVPELDGEGGKAILQLVAGGIISKVLR